MCSGKHRRKFAVSLDVQSAAVWAKNVQMWWLKTKRSCLIERANLAVDLLLFKRAQVAYQAGFICAFSLH